MKKTFLFWVLIFVFGMLSGQNEGNNWYFGYRAGVSFSGGVATGLTNGKTNQYEGVSSISTQSGQLLFYSDGAKVWNANHTVMPNGAGLNGTQSTTQTVIIPVPGSDSLYYVISSDALSGNANIWYSVVDMSLDAGLGDLSLVNQPLGNGLTEKMCVISHANGVDSWLVTHEIGTNQYRSYFLSCGGFSNSPVISAVGTVHTAPGGYMKPSHDGQMIGVCLVAQDTVEILHFNNRTGVLTNPLAIGGLNSPYGLEFSPDGRLLYVSTDYTISEILQFDITTGNPSMVASSRYSVCSSFFAGYTALQLGPDGVIYSGRSLSNYLASIVQPDLAGMACAYSDSGVNLYAGMVFHGLPNTYETYPHPWLDSVGFSTSAMEMCPGSALSVTNTSTFIPDYAEFVIRHQNGMLIDSLAGNSATVNLQQPGLYRISMRVERSCLKDTVVKTVLVRPRPNPALGLDTVLCGATSFDLIPQATGLSLNWWNGQTGPMASVTTSGTYWVEGSDGICQYRDSIQVDFRAIPDVNVETELMGCEGAPVQLGYANPVPGQFQWTTGATTSSIQVNQAGVYTLTRTVNGCSNSQNITVEMTAAPVPVLPATTWICEGEEIDLEVAVKADYVTWNTGEQTRQIHITQPGTYAVTAFSNGCTGQASTEVKEAKLPVLSLPAQVVACAGEVIQLAPEHSADVSAFIWSDGSMANALAVTESGHYAVQASNRCGVAEAETEVVIHALPALNLGEDRTLCREDQIVLYGPEGEFSYLWSDGSMTRDLKIQVPGVYRLTLENECGIASDEVEITGGNAAPPVPNVFTPNGDGINDQFIIREVDGQDFILNITDRWGQIAFSTKNPQEGWNGLMQNGGSAPEGAYFYSLRMRGCDGKLVESAGSVTLMR